MATPSGTDAHRERILKVALSLLTRQGREAVTTRNVAEAAKVQPPVLYRIFGDKNGLLEAVASYGFAAYLAKKQPVKPEGDVLELLRAGWDLHVEFALANPELYLLMYADPRPGVESEAAGRAYSILRAHMEAVAVVGRLRVSVEKACTLYHAAALGVVMVLLAKNAAQRDLKLSTFAREHTLAGLITDVSAVSVSNIAAAANQFNALLGEQDGKCGELSEGEKVLLSEWLLRFTEPNV